METSKKSDETQEKTLEDVALQPTVESIPIEDDADIEGIVFYENVKDRSHQKRQKEVVKFPNPNVAHGYDAFLIQALSMKEQALVNGTIMSPKKMQQIATELMKDKPNLTAKELDDAVLDTMSDDELASSNARKSVMTVHLGVRKPTYSLDEVENLKLGYVNELYRRIELLGSADANFLFSGVADASEQSEPETDA